MKQKLKDLKAIVYSNFENDFFTFACYSDDDGMWVFELTEFDKKIEVVFMAKGISVFNQLSMKSLENLSLTYLHYSYSEVKVKNIKSSK